MRGSPFGDMFKSNPDLRRFFKEMPSQPGMGCRSGAVGAGSGVIVDPSGVILTNNHVVAGGGKVIVRLQDGREFKATNIKTDPKSDIAILRIEGAGKLPAAKLGNSDERRSRRLGARPRRAVRTGRHRHGGHRQREGTRVGHRRPRRLHPNRRRHQSRQQRRTAGESRRRSDRHQHRHFVQQRRQSRRRLRHAHQLGEMGRRRTGEKRHGAPRLPGRDHSAGDANARRTIQRESPARACS